MKETPNTVHGRLLEAAHISGYSFERACSELEWLLDENRWQDLGFKDGSAFVRSIESAFSEFRISIDQRKPLVAKLSGIASQRAVADALGVNKDTVRNDLNGGENSPEAKPKATETEESESASGENSPKPKPSNGKDSARPHVSKNSGENEWYTPPEYIEAARLVMGSIDTDPASSAVANETVGAYQFYTAEDDGLTQPWRGNVWLNPPYAMPLIEEFSTALVTRWKDSEISQACVLVNNATDTQWFQRMAKRAALVCFPTKRIKFLDPEGNPGAPLQGQAVLYFGQNGEAFSKTFRQFGVITKIMRSA